MLSHIEVDILFLEIGQFGSSIDMQVDVRILRNEIRKDRPQPADAEACRYSYLEASVFAFF